MKTHTVGIIMNGVTGRMGTNQHLIRSIQAIRNQGGVKISEGEVIMPEPVLTGIVMGDNEEILRKLSETHGLPSTTDLDALLKDDRYPVYFDAQRTSARFESVKKAIGAGKHIYCEKPTATNSKDAAELYTLAKAAGVKHGVVQDKLWLPGLLKLKGLIDTGFFGEIFAVRCEFGYWVFTGEHGQLQRPSWNYRKEDGGGIILDMFPHWQYVVSNLFGAVKSLSCLGATHIKKRWDEQGQPYDCTAEDAVFVTFVTENGAICHFNCAWNVRVRRDDLVVFQVEGTKGTAVVGLRKVLVQDDANTPRPVWNPDLESTADYYADWTELPSEQHYDNAFKAQWELFLRHVVLDEPFPWDLKEGAKGVQLAELGHESWQKRAWVDVPEL